MPIALQFTSSVIESIVFCLEGTAEHDKDSMMYSGTSLLQTSEMWKSL